MFTFRMNKNKLLVGGKNMDYIKIGKFIACVRKEKNMTQAELAEKLSITDRAVSKWERGRGFPDASILLLLCETLDIQVNELLVGEKIERKDYNKVAEKTLLEFYEREEKQNKNLLLYEKVIGYLTSLTFLILIFVDVYYVKNTSVQIALFLFSFLVLILGVSFALKIETEAGYYACKYCKNKYVPKYKDVYFAMHFGTTRYMKCPKCGKRSFQKKVMR